MSNIEDIEDQNAKAAIEKALEILGEHYGAVQILATHETHDGKSAMTSIGYGNWYARQGMAHEFIEMNSAVNFAYQINEGTDDEE